MQIESLAGIRHALQDHRREALTAFFKEFMTVLEGEGYSFEDLLHAAADWANERPNANELVNKLEKAIDEIRN